VAAGSPGAASEQQEVRRIDRRGSQVSRKTHHRRTTHGEGSNWRCSGPPTSPISTKSVLSSRRYLSPPQSTEAASLTRTA
jgi:hypothetical protein